MNSEVINDDVEMEEDDLEEDEAESFDETIVMSETDDSDGIGDTTVERIITDFEQTDAQAAARKMKVSRKLEELAEEQSIEDTFAVEFLKD